MRSTSLRYLMKYACSLICNVFSHGSVYRIGGDEFVVLLQNRGYDTMEEDIQTFNAIVEKNIKTKDVVVSLGYSALTDSDSMVRQIFERADNMMYERKKQLKALGASTRED